MDGGFLSKLKPFVWGENLDISEFEAGWKSLMDEFKMTDNEWLCDMYECRHLWIPAYFKEDPLSGILRTTSWSESANSFFSHYHQPGDYSISVFIYVLRLQWISNVISIQT